MLQYFLIWLLLVSGILVIWNLIQDEKARVREEKHERAIKAAEILKKEPVRYSNLTPEDLMMLIEVSEQNHERYG